MANEVEIRIIADPKAAEEGFKKTQSAFGKMSAAIEKHRKKIGLGLTALGGGITALGASAVKSAQEEAIGINQLDQALQNVGSSYDSQAAAIEKVIAAQQNKTNFGDEQQRVALMNLISISGDYEKSMAALPAVLDLAAGKNMDLSAASTLVARAVNGETSALTRYGIQVEKGAGATEVLTAIMAKFGGQAESAADPMVQLQNRMGDFQQELGKALLPALTSLMTLLESITRKLIAFSQEHPKLSKVLFIVIAAIGGLALVLGPILIMLPLLAGGVGIVTGAFGALSLSMLPITAIVLGIVAAITAAILIYKNWDKIILVLKETWTKSWNKIKEVFWSVMNKIKDLYDSKLGWLMPAGPLFKAIMFIKDNWREAWENIKEKFRTITSAVKTIFEGFKSNILGIWDGLTSGIKAAINTIINAINGFIRGFNRIKISVPSIPKPSFLGGGSWGGFNVGVPQIPEIPTLARGGIVNRPTLAMIGEAGPEAVVPLNRGMGMTINLTIQGDVLGMDDFEEKITTTVRDAVLAGGFSGVLSRA